MKINNNKNKAEAKKAPNSIQNEISANGNS